MTTINPIVIENTDKGNEVFIIEGSGDEAPRITLSGYRDGKGNLRDLPNTVSAILVRENEFRIQCTDGSEIVAPNLFARRTRASIAAFVPEGLVDRSSVPTSVFSVAAAEGNDLEISEQVSYRSSAKDHYGKRNGAASRVITYTTLGPA